jgi:hypothetical protein
MFTTTLVGAHMQYNFSHNLPFFDVERDLDIFTVGLRSPQLFMSCNRTCPQRLAHRPRSRTL